MAETVVQRLRRRELPRAAARRAIRAAIFVPGTFAISYLLLGDPTAALFSAVGSVTLLLYVDFGGPIWPRLQSQANLILITLVLLCLGSLAAQSLWIAVPATLIVTFVILFSGIVSSVLAGAQTSMLVSFLLPLTLIGPVDSIPHRVLGWLIASAGSLIAITLVWPGPTNEPLRLAAIRACTALGGRAAALAVRFGGAADVGRSDAGTAAAGVVAAAAMDDAVAELRKAFLGTPYRPSGLGTAARELAKTIEQLFLLAAALRQLDTASARSVPEIEAMLATTGAVLADCADILAVSRADTADLVRRRDDLAAERERMQSVTVGTAWIASRPGDRSDVMAALRPSFAAQQVAGITDSIVAHTLAGANARARTWFGHVLGIRPAGVAPALATARDRAGAHFDWSSVWLRNSTRGAIGFTLTVLVANLAGVEHAFWVAFGTLAVLRSSASATGQNAIRALAGTFIGIVVGGVFITLIGSDTTLCWILLPIAVAFTGIAPAFSFTAGQAGFSVILILLFDLISPTAWTIGIVRIDDVAIGCAVSVVVGLLLWPRGASSRFGAALADALSESAHYLGAATDYALMQCSGTHTTSRPMVQQRGAADAARRLDDSFRQFIAERGAKHLSLADVGTLVLGVAELRRTADGICALWGDAGVGVDTGSSARTEVLLAGGSTVEWYEELAAALTGAAAPPATTSAFRRAGDRVEDEIAEAARHMNAAESATAIRMIWTLDYLDSVRELEGRVLPIATHAAEAAASRAAWFAGVRRRRPAAPAVE